ncbi:SemiSWEET family sugar transporter [Rhodoplanes sp. Z2-YC6860]|uniref:SemiSWEET family sugar transporter n=1 Tax=Rhodoplanes sp. Z2-YC6860 TaxID=674703 RepID=UPI00078CBDC3|nr:SemiSWEET transporter [Rhodoplanes sp. Z2-YC6860]AMN40436.1 sugar efflux transporter for intercellular exchange [Rhodoplanes sp. Z2-YC6860]
MMDVNTAVGAAAAICTTLSYFPQLKKRWQTGETGDLSLWMFVILFVGLALWMTYGFLKTDYIILAANGVSLCCLAGILFFKIRGVAAGSDPHPS